MKLKIIYFIAVFVSLLFSCTKEIIFKDNPSLKHKKQLIFNSLTVNDPVVFPSVTTSIFASANGDSVRYHWSATSGTIVGTDSVVQYSCNTNGEYVISCVITDKYGFSQSKQVSLVVTEQLVYSSLATDDTLVPPGMSASIRSIASGLNLEYIWTVSSGSIEGTGDHVSFISPGIGDYVVTCTVKDQYNQELTKTINITCTNQLIFKSLIANPSEVHPLDYSQVVAIAYGEGLIYQWEARPAGNILGSGDTVLFEVCHTDKFTVSCNITDKYGNRIGKGVDILVTPTNP